MSIEILLSREYIFYTIIGLTILLFILQYLIKKQFKKYQTAQFIKKSKKRRNKRFNGLNLVEKIAKKRKKNTNSFKKLKRSGKKQVNAYFHYKSRELPKIISVIKNESLKPADEILYIIFKTEKEILSKIPLELGYSGLINNSNQYDCLDELILFLHHLPDALLAKKEYDIFIQDKQMLITYILQ